MQVDLGAIEEQTLSTALTVLSAMITPAVLISACGSLIIATSGRLGRVVDRTRKLSEQFATLAGAGEPADPEQRGEERALIFAQLDRATRRSRLLQRAMTRLYLALSVFVATSVAIGVVAVWGQRYAWVPVLLGLAGAGLLFHASVLLIVESRVALSAIDEEMDFVWRLGEQQAPDELVNEARRARARRFRPGRRP